MRIMKTRYLVVTGILAAVLSALPAKESSASPYESTQSRMSHVADKVSDSECKRFTKRHQVVWTDKKPGEDVNIKGPANSPKCTWEVVARVRLRRFTDSRGLGCGKLSGCKMQASYGESEAVRDHFGTYFSRVNDSFEVNVGRLNARDHAELRTGRCALGNDSDSMWHECEVDVEVVYEPTN